MSALFQAMNGVDWHRYGNVDDTCVVVRNTWIFLRSSEFFH